MSNTVHVVSFSGGKDSTALYLWAIENLGRDGFTPIFSDTGWEHELTYQFVRELPAKANGPEIVWLKPEMDFVELAKKKGRFPSPTMRFCTQELKVKPSRTYLQQLLMDGYDPILYTGVRRDESPARANTPEEEFDDRSACLVRCPLASWNVEMVWEIHRRHGIDPNPLYKMGMGRVGCMPCVMANKPELAAIAKRLPDVFSKVRDAEAEVGRTFWAPETVSQGFHSKTSVAKKDGAVVPICTADDVMRWATPEAAGQIPMFAEDSCASRYGLCE